MPVDIAVAQRQIAAALCEKWIEEVRLSPSHWSLRFSNDLWLVAQALEFPTEQAIKALLASSEPDLLGGMDSENVPKMTCLAALMRQEVTACRVHDDGSLTIYFEGGGELAANAKVPIVDWQWSLGVSPGDPYKTPHVACCLFLGEVEAGTAWSNQY